MLDPFLGTLPATGDVSLQPARPALSRRQTPFHARTRPLCHSWDWRNWSGYAMASRYQLGHEPEYFSIRSSAALLDVTPLFKYEIHGRDAAALLDRVVTREASALAVGRMLYTPWCDEAGQVIDDGTVARLGPQRFRLTSAHPSLGWLSENALGFQVEIQDVSERLGALAVQGPRSRELLAALAGPEVGALRYYSIVPARIAGAALEISRTGYTGDLGYELWVPAENALGIWDELVERGRAHGLQPAGLLALDLARIEAGLILVDVDYVSAHRAQAAAQTSSPYELGLGWTVKLEKPYFVGRSALLAEARAGSRYALRGLEVAWDPLERLYDRVDLAPQLPVTPWRGGIPVFADGGQVGKATSGCWSPLLKRYLALATLEAHWAQPGWPLELEVTVEYVRHRVPARVVSLPFLDLPRRRA